MNTESAEPIGNHTCNPLITDTERKVLKALRDKGDGLTMEIATRLLVFPEEVAPALRSLQRKQLVISQPLMSSTAGPELWGLTPLGAILAESIMLIETPGLLQPNGRYQQSGDAHSLLVKQVTLLKELVVTALRMGNIQAAEKYNCEMLAAVEEYLAKYKPDKVVGATI